LIGGHDAIGESEIVGAAKCATKIEIPDALDPEQGLTECVTAGWGPVVVQFHVWLVEILGIAIKRREVVGALDCPAESIVYRTVVGCLRNP